MVTVNLGQSNRNGSAVVFLTWNMAVTQASAGEKLVTSTVGWVEDVVGVTFEVERSQPGEEGLPRVDLGLASSASHADRGARCHRPADEHYGGIGGESLPLGQRVRDLELAGTVEHDAQRAVVTVFEHEHDGPVELGAAERGGGHEQPPGHGELGHPLRFFQVTPIALPK